jgi:hypothetical protein
VFRFYHEIRGKTKTDPFAGAGAKLPLDLSGGKKSS